MRCELNACLCFLVLLTITGCSSSNVVETGRWTQWAEWTAVPGEENTWTRSRDCLDEDTTGCEGYHEETKSFTYEEMMGGSSSSGSSSSSSSGKISSSGSVSYSSSESSSYGGSYGGIMTSGSTETTFFTEHEAIVDVEPESSDTSSSLVNKGVWGEWSQWADDSQAAGWKIRSRECITLSDTDFCDGWQTERLKITEFSGTQVDISTSNTAEFQDWSYDIDVSGSTVENVSEDWEAWSDWFKDADGWWVRTRKCKTGSKCRGVSKQRRRKRSWKCSGEWAFATDDGGVEYAEDWEIWGEWKLDRKGRFVRERKCKNKDKAKCRGSKTQIKRKLKKVKRGGHGSGGLDEHDKLFGSWSFDQEVDSGGELSEVLEDWQPWTEWKQEGNSGWWVRTRVCKNKGSKCRGKSKQRKRQRSWKVVGSWSIDEDQDKQENLADWKAWSEWVQQFDGCWIRRRICKKGDVKNCKGKFEQKRRKKKKVPTATLR